MESVAEFTSKFLSKLTPDQTSLVSMLNEEQYSAVVNIMYWVNAPVFGAQQAHILVGFAGTGKTFLVKLLASLIGSSVALCAPTNKAVKELAKLGTDYKNICLRS
jgi:DNA replication protein DnaC